MSGISSYSGTNPLVLAVYNAGLTQRSIDKLTAESSSGFISPDFAGLGSGARAALDLTGQLAVNTSLQSDAAKAANVNQVTQTALGQIQVLVSGVANQLLSASVSTNSGLSTLAASARSALEQVASLLNTKVGQVYIFAGQDSRSPPIPDPANITQSTFYTAIQSAVSSLATNSPASVQAQLLVAAGAGATSPFSPSLEGSNQPAVVNLGNGEVVQQAVLADQNTDAVSAGGGTSSTGSYIRDALMALSAVSTLGTASSADPKVQTLLGNMQTTLSGANDALNTDIGGLGARQDTISDAQTELSDTGTALTTQLGSLQDADPALVATRLSNAQMELQASYKIIASLSQLSLAKFL